MNPGTHITFDKNKNIVILEKGDYIKFRIQVNINKTTKELRGVVL
ncbi:hypothetical protein UT300019_09070 [Clostridium sp. CTA-19]